MRKRCLRCGSELHTGLARCPRCRCALRAVSDNNVHPGHRGTVQTSCAFD
ncbi:MAG: hypothetical protein ACLFUV_09365 [Methanomassiliicoccales archaeon]